VLDFVCLEMRLVVEVDGGQHLDDEGDKERDKCLQEAGFLVLRFWNNEVLRDIDTVAAVIWSALQRDSQMATPSPPQPSP
jgi:very-short-patch-repair endonuclease